MLRFKWKSKDISIKRKMELMNMSITYYGANHSFGLIPGADNKIVATYKAMLNAILEAEPPATS